MHVLELWGNWSTSPKDPLSHFPLFPWFQETEIYCHYSPQESTLQSQRFLHSTIILQVAGPLQGRQTICSLIQTYQQVQPIHFLTCFIPNSALLVPISGAHRVKAEITTWTGPKCITSFTLTPIGAIWSLLLNLMHVFGMWEDTRVAWQKGTFFSTNTFRQHYLHFPDFLFFFK